MKWIYRSIVLILLTGSMLLNGLQYVGSAMLDGVYNLAETITGITSVSALQKKEATLAKQKRLAQGAKLKGLQSRVANNLKRVIGRGATRVGVESVPIPGEMFLIPAFVALEAGFVYQDIKDQCQLLDDLNDWVISFEFETQTRPEYCGYTPAELAKKLPSETEFKKTIAETSVGNMMNEYGRVIYEQSQGWGHIYREAVKIEEGSPLFMVGASIAGLERKAAEGWASLKGVGSKASEYLKGLWKDL